MPFLVRGEKSAHVFSTHLGSYRWLELMQGLSPRGGAPSWKLNLFAEGKAAVDYVASWFSYICPDYSALSLDDTLHRHLSLGTAEFCG